MRFYIFIIFICCSSFYHIDTTQKHIPSTTSLSVQVNNIDATGGTLRLGLFSNAKSFPDTPSKGQNITITKQKKAIFQVDNLAYGKYAIAIYHDLNNNGVLDKNSFGIPLEPFGFSNNIRVKWKAPVYKDAAFDFAATTNNLQIDIYRW